MKRKLYTAVVKKKDVKENVNVIKFVQIWMEDTE